MTAATERVDNTLGRKLDQRRFTDMSDKMTAVVAFILGEASVMETDPAIRALHIIEPDVVLIEHEGEVGGNHVLGTFRDLIRNWGNLLDAAELTTSERRRAMYLFGVANIKDHRIPCRVRDGQCITHGVTADLGHDLDINGYTRADGSARDD